MNESAINKLTEEEIARNSKITSKNVRVTPPNEDVTSAFKEIADEVNGKWENTKK